MEWLKVKCTTIQEMLGTASPNPDIYRDYIASKAPEAKDISDEIAALGEDAVFQNKTTVFPRAQKVLDDGTPVVDENGNPVMVPIIFDYQIKGFLKDAAKMLRKASPMVNKKGEKVPFRSSSVKAYKEEIDGLIFVYPREIPIEGKVSDKIFQRPLRADTAQGKMIAIASSELIEAGATMEFSFKCLNDSDVEWIKECLNYGQNRGFLQWRNAGFGRFTWEEVE